jgi:D-alanyl-D-alanine carboxypeptidase/D-alanyl-D-alanine-endopeptidase (penicillin-binding protein 4)
MKIYPTAVALDLLGPEYRWRTSVYATNPPDADGTINGRFDFCTVAAHLISRFQKKPKACRPSVDQLRQRGVRRVRGKIIGDES